MRSQGALNRKNVVARRFEGFRPDGRLLFEPVELGRDAQVIPHFAHRALQRVVGLHLAPDFAERLFGGAVRHRRRTRDHVNAARIGGRELGDDFRRQAVAPDVALAIAGQILEGNHEHDGGRIRIARTRTQREYGERRKKQRRIPAKASHAEPRRWRGRARLLAAGRRRKGGTGRRAVDAPDESITTPGQCFDERRMIGVVAERGAHLLDAEVETMLEVDGGVIAPHLAPKLLARHQLARPAQERRKHAERLELELDRRAAAKKLGAAQVRGELAEGNHVVAPAFGLAFSVEAARIGYASVVRHRRDSREHVVGTKPAARAIGGGLDIAGLRARR